MRKHDKVVVRKTGQHGVVINMFKSIDKPIGVQITGHDFMERFDYKELEIQEVCKC